MSQSEDIRLDGRSAYLATPIATDRHRGPWPGVVVVHDAFGITDDMREQADWLAAAGYVAVVPDLYAGKAAVRWVRSMFAQQGPVFDQVDSVRTWLAGSAGCSGKVGVIGHCLGGGFALLLAGRPGWSAASINYGMLPDDVTDILAGACPVVASFGRKGKGLRGAADALRRAASKAGVPADVKEYPRAGHGFINRITAASPLTPMLRVVQVGYDHAAAADAKRRILTFFEAHLRQPLPTSND